MDSEFLNEGERVGVLPTEYFYDDSCTLGTTFVCMQQECCGYCYVCSYHMHLIGFMCVSLKT